MTKTGHGPDGRRTATGAEVDVRLRGAPTLAHLGATYRNRLDRDTFAQRVVLVLGSTASVSPLSACEHTVWSTDCRRGHCGAAAAAPPLPPVAPSEHTSNKVHGTCTPPRNTMPHADAHHAHALVPTQAMIHRHRFLRTRPMSSAKRVPWAPTRQSECMPKLPAKFGVVRSSSVCACIDMHAACNIRSPTRNAPRPPLFSTMPRH